MSAASAMRATTRGAAHNNAHRASNPALPRRWARAHAPSTRAQVVSTVAARAQPRDDSSGSKPAAAPAVPAVVQSTLALQGALMTFHELSGDAFAKGGELGILEGRTAALIHPAVMFFLLGGTAWAGYLGWQFRSIRTVGDEIKDLKAQKKSAEAALASSSAAAGGTATATVAVAPEIDAKIDELSDKRKKLVDGKFRDRHYAWGNILLAAGGAISIEGPLNTYARTGKLFPGPHLYAGAGITACWALAAALVPSMQKGSKVARDAHITLNALNFALFLWQVPTGLEIVQKVFQFTKWP